MCRISSVPVWVDVYLHMVFLPQLWTQRCLYLCLAPMHTFMAQEWDESIGCFHTHASINLSFHLLWRLWWNPVNTINQIGVKVCVHSCHETFNGSSPPNGYSTPWIGTLWASYGLVFNLPLRINTHCINICKYIEIDRIVCMLVKGKKCENESITFYKILCFFIIHYSSIDLKIMIQSISERWNWFPYYIFCLFQNPFLCNAFMHFAHWFYIGLYCQLIFRLPTVCLPPSHLSAMHYGHVSLYMWLIGV